MSIESLAPRTEAPAPTFIFTPPAEPAPVPAQPQTGTAVEATATPPSLQERRLRVARELDARINSLEQDIRQIGDALAQSRLGTTGSLRELQQCSTSLTTDLLRVGARLAQQGSAQEKIAGQLERRLQEVDRAMAALTAELHVQTEGQRELQERHDSLARLHQHLDRIVNRQGRNVNILSAELQQRVELLRISIEGLQTVFYAHQESLMGLTLEHEQLALLTRLLQEQLGEFGDRLDVHIDHTSQRLRLQAILLATFAVLSLVLITYCQFNPIAVPPDVSGQLTTMASGFAQQKSQAATLAAQHRLQDERLAAITAALDVERRETRRLRQGARRTNNRLTELDRQLADLRAARAPINPTPTPPQSPTPAGAWPSAPVTGGITLPPALSGSRPAF